MLYIRALEKVVNERDFKRGQYAQAKRVGESTLHEIKTALQNQQVDGPNNETPIRGKTSKDLNQNSNESDHSSLEGSELLLCNEDGEIKIDSEKFFIPFEMASMGDCPSVTNAALDGLQKLIAHGQLTGNYPNLQNPNKKLIDRIVETICTCYIGADTDEGVELQIIKALLTIVTSEYVQIHEGSLLLTLRTCYSIYLSTRNTVNQTTARAMLTQMLSAVFSRMETVLEGDPHVPETQLSSENNNYVPISSAFLEKVTEPLQDWEWESISWYSKLDLYIFSRSIEESGAGHLTGFPETENSTPELCAEVNGVMDASDAMTGLINESDSNSINVDVNSNLQNDTATEPISTTDESAKKEAIEKAIIKPNQIMDTPMSSSFTHILQKDAFLTFWALCKMAMKANSNEEPPTEISKIVEVKSKILSFQLLKSVMDNCGMFFKTSPVFLTAIKQYLCTAMSKAAISPTLEIFQLNLDLLGGLIRNFRNSAKMEVEVLYEELLFPVLEPSNSFSVEYRLLVLGVVNKLLSNIQSAIDLVVNYDLSGQPQSRVFERMIKYVCQIEKKRPDLNQTLQDSIRMLSIETIVTFLKNLAAFCSNKVESTSKDFSNPQEESTEPSNDANHADEIPISSEDSNESKDPSTVFVLRLVSFLVNIPPSAELVEVDLLIQKFAKNIAGSLTDTSFSTLESADNIYALVYSTISLIGELSNRNQVRSKEQFLKMNPGINGCEPLNEDYVSGIYDEIQAYLIQDECNRKHTSCHQESTGAERVGKAAKRLIAMLGLQKCNYPEAQLRQMKRMLKIMGKPCLSMLLGTLTECDESETTVADLCLDGIQSAICVTSLLNMKKERDAFVQSLSKMSLIALKEIKGRNVNAMVIKSKTSSTTTTENGITKTTVTTTTETKCRNVDIILTLLNVAIREGNYLENAWLDTLKCISQLEAAQLLGNSSPSGADSNRSHSPNVQGTHPQQSQGQKWYSWAGSLVPYFWDPSGNKKLDMASVKESLGALSHKIFFESCNLDGNAIVDFFKGLCQVSLIEITHPESPRSFVYEKIFEVAFLNINRPCLHWYGIWKVLSDYFSHLACSSDEEVSFFAIDSVTKLSVYLLEKETLGNFRFQSYYLYPFETIIRNTPFSSIREYVLESIMKIIQSHSTILRSGWIPLLNILELTVYDESSNNAAVSFGIITNILDMFEKGEINLVDSFSEIVRCLKDLSFKAPTYTIEAESHKYLQKLARLLHDKPELWTSELGAGDNTPWAKGWCPIFSELSNVVLHAAEDDMSIEDQANGLIILFNLIKQYGHSFVVEWWKPLFDILFVIYNELKNHEESISLEAEDSKQKQLSIEGKYGHYYCYYYMQFAIVDTYVNNYESIAGTDLLRRVTQEISWCIFQAEEQISLSGIQCFNQIISSLQAKLTTSEWNVVFELIMKLLDTSFMGNPIPTENGESSDQRTTKSASLIVQLELLKLVKNLLFMHQKDAETETANKAENEGKQSESKSEELRDKLTQHNFLSAIEIVSKVYHKTVTELGTEFIPHEALSLEVLLKILFKLYSKTSLLPPSNQTFIETKLLNLVCNALERFVNVSTPNYQDAFIDVIQWCLKSIFDLPNTNFIMFTNQSYPLLCDMLELKLYPGLGAILCKYFLKIGKIVEIVHENGPEADQYNKFVRSI